MLAIASIYVRMLIIRSFDVNFYIFGWKVLSIFQILWLAWELNIEQPLLMIYALFTLMLIVLLKSTKNVNLKLIFLAQKQMFIICCNICPLHHIFEFKDHSFLLIDSYDFPSHFFYENKSACYCFIVKNSWAFDKIYAHLWLFVRYCSINLNKRLLGVKFIFRKSPINCNSPIFRTSNHKELRARLNIIRTIISLDLILLMIRTLHDHAPHLPGVIKRNWVFDLIDCHLAWVNILSHSVDKITRIY